MQRDLSFDTAKGFAIYSVVLCHLVSFLDWDNEILMHYIESYFMPVFFFISGYFGYKKEINSVSVIKKRFKELVVPYFTIGFFINLIWCYVRDISFWNHYLLDESKGGFWFLLVLFFYFLIYAGAKTVAPHNDKIVFGILAGVYLVSFFAATLFPQNLSWLLSLMSIRKFMPIFIVGLLVCKYKSQIKPWTVSCFIVSAIIYVTTTSLTFHIEAKTYFSMALWSIGAIFGPIFYIGLFKRLNFFDKIFSFCGRYSLTVYLYHYVFIYILKALTPPLFQFETNLCNIVSINFMLFSVAALITYLCSKAGSACTDFKYRYYFGL